MTGRGKGRSIKNKKGGGERDGEKERGGRKRRARDHKITDWFTIPC